MITAREAMQQAIERAQLGDIEAGTLWLGIATELRRGTVAVANLQSASLPPLLDPEIPIVLADDGQLAYGRAETDEVKTVPERHPDGFTDWATYRAETEVLQRIPEESTPAYEAAGESLGETRNIPSRIAHPDSDSVGPVGVCLSCEEPIVWIRGRGWCHDVPSHTASCDKAAEERGV